MIVWSAVIKTFWLKIADHQMKLGPNSSKNLECKFYNRVMRNRECRWGVNVPIKMFECFMFLYCLSMWPLVSLCVPPRPTNAWDKPQLFFRWQLSVMIAVWFSFRWVKHHLQWIMRCVWRQSTFRSSVPFWVPIRRLRQWGAYSKVLVSKFQDKTQHSEENHVEVCKVFSISI